MISSSHKLANYRGRKKMLSARARATPPFRSNPPIPPPTLCQRLFAGATISSNRKGSLRTIHNSGRRDAINGGDRASLEIPIPPTPRPPVNHNGRWPDGDHHQAGEIKVTATVVVRNKFRATLVDKLQVLPRSVANALGLGIFIQLISEEIDPETKTGKSVLSSVKGCSPNFTDIPQIVEYNSSFTVPINFGTPGAILVTNCLCQEFFLVEIILYGLNEAPIYFPANSWIQPQKVNNDLRIIFRNQAYLPSQTPRGIKDLRHEDLLNLRGSSRKQEKRKAHERIYDYAPYNDLCSIEKYQLARPTLGGKARPYPRRCRTGRPLTESDDEFTTKSRKDGPFYVPRDEAFEDIKQDTFSSGRLRGMLHNLIPQITASVSTSEVSFNCFSDIDKLYNDGLVLNDGKHGGIRFPIIQGIAHKLHSISNKLFKYQMPAILKRDRFAWLRDTEFARQALAGVNPVAIELLKEFPIVSKLDHKDYGPPESAITKEVLQKEMNGISVEEAIEKKQLFMMDYHDLILPIVDKINSLKGRKAYASRTIFHLSEPGILKPIAIELSLPETESSPSFKRVYTHGHGATAHWCWNLAKAHVCAVDSGVHQLVNHWLRTHACMEPYIIAMHRHLSTMHPIYKLLHPHTRYTLEINALARQSLINADGVIEDCFTPGKYAMEISSVAYKASWQFNMEALPNDLLRRGMAEEDPSSPCGVKLVIEDYPYAADGLLLWYAIKEHVESYVAHFYREANSVSLDLELQQWWKEIKNQGHPDKKDEPWWPKLESEGDLAGILTTMIWVASGQHAAINFGQYPFGGYVPNRPTLMRKLIPQEDEDEYKDFMLDPQRTFLSALPNQLQATKVMAVQETLSTHSADEEYLGEQDNFLHKHWINDGEVKDMFRRFSREIQKIERIISRRNENPLNKNRCGAGIPPYELLLPASKNRVTGSGIPNSVSI